VARRPLLTVDQWAPLVVIPTAEENMVRHYTLSGEDIHQALAKSRYRNEFGFAVQLCLMRFPGRTPAPIQKSAGTTS